MEEGGFKMSEMPKNTFPVQSAHGKLFKMARGKNHLAHQNFIFYTVLLLQLAFVCIIFAYKTSLALQHQYMFTQMYKLVLILQLHLEYVCIFGKMKNGGNERENST